MRPTPSLGRGEAAESESALQCSAPADGTNRLAASQEQFLRHAAHALKMPLAIWALELARINDPRARRVEVEVLAMGETIDRLLLIARLGSSSEIARQNLDLASICQTVMKRLSALQLAKSCQLKLCTEYQAGSGPDAVAGDPDLIEAAIEAIVHNAIRHSSEGCNIRIRMTRQAKVEVDDDGTGFPDGLGVPPFAPFRHGPKPSDGPGLGLALADRIMQAHGGKLSVGRSDLGGAGVVLAFQEVTLSNGSQRG